MNKEQGGILIFNVKAIPKRRIHTLPCLYKKTLSLVFPRLPLTIRDSSWHMNEWEPGIKQNILSSWKESDAFETLHFIKLDRDGLNYNFSTLEEVWLCSKRVSHKEKRRKKETKKVIWWLVIQGRIVNVSKEEKLINRCSIAFHVI